MASPSVLTIEELSGPGRRLELVGPGLPLRGAAWPVEQRLVTTWYQGAKQASQQVLGHVDRPSSWSGIWRTPLLVSYPCRFFESSSAAGLPVVDAFTLYELVGSIAKEARLLRVTWGAGQGLGTRERTISRVGRIQEFEPEFDRADDIRWKLTVEWVGRDGEEDAPAPTRGESLLATMAGLSKSMGDIASQLEAARAKRSNLAIPVSANTFTLGDLEQLAEAPSRLVDDVARAARQIETQANQVGAVIAKVRGTPDALREQCSGIVRSAEGTLSRLRLATGTLPVEGCSSEDSRVAPALNGWNYAQQGSAGASKGAGAASDAKRTVGKKGSGIEFDESGRRFGSRDVKKTHVSKQGETFASIALRYYGDTSRAADIARANGFPGYQVAPPPGTPLAIPSFDSPSAGTDA